jgi:hypothetical protein
VEACICLSISFCSEKYSLGKGLCGISIKLFWAVIASLLVGIILLGLSIKFAGFIQLLGDQIHHLFNDLFIYSLAEFFLKFNSSCKEIIGSTNHTALCVSVSSKALISSKGMQVISSISITTISFTIDTLYNHSLFSSKL